MLDAISDFAQTLLGIGQQHLNPGQTAVRAALTFVITLAIVRLGDKRLFGKGTAFDMVVAIMIGSVMSHAVTDPSPPLAAWVAGGMLVGMHWLSALLSYHLDWFGPLVKGNPVLLVKDGHIRRNGMREASVSRMDLDQGLRESGHEPDPSRVQVSYLERDGSISVVPCRKEPRVLAVSVADGVQTVRIAVE